MPVGPLVKVAIRAFAVAVPAHFGWEMAQADLFVGMPPGFREATAACALASVGDGVLTLIILGVGAAAFGTAAWLRLPGWLTVLCLSLIVAVMTEWTLVYGLKRWAYDTDMPIVPGLRVGLTPLLQMVLLTPPILWWASRGANRSPGRR